ncbi:pyridine nucleotide-disulfide oxidoreductase family protein [Mycolicibacterium hassiacum DSM 44199]|uniref:Pyridine nucleotide-disulfide oxidoreductase family protein n=1 Tax=Mycolicibacterium hassiacum (strain DSM 44199 / CIP 105218 / JCM 12690 / 3849) TaxID=1122247 RepID=K5BHW8_MYCHD|nr:NAD(P)/FAD-dependent oxidoreductase [Mycolicibacterium hassiacum]EKF25296.1 pyridine nucleotide-disulfide oxidoreductase family protein [Mycolicibacterium hassiacum DSM 44199]MBX5486353.1 NAD(P)/FAD-dependent oxidoreductase [Mycolicibacterium hassiacum]MDA4087999.1 FAD-dependent pyridine nucleotide-disulfide oxidoreductase [Mycolicibacterium hassiacum DSM 44199]PZN21373.1 MAG: NAD(P)/FAD-dependent oxidoreductase [Mycolicibacterium hassiacum]VCT88370.1 Thioredoxin reductase [Mycolicibacteriu
MEDNWECAVVGAGAAGLSAALVLGRARRRTVVFDAGEQSNLASATIGGLLGFDQRSPADLYAQGRRELDQYPSVEFRDCAVAGGRAVDGGFILEPDDGDPVVAKRVLLATGMRYCPPEIPGLAELWGRSVFQCPFCHGWEMRDKRLATLARGEEAVHSALMLRGWSDDVVLLTNGSTELSVQDTNLLAAAGVVVDDRRVSELVGADGQLTAIAFDDGSRLERDGLLVEAPLRQRSPLAKQLELECVSNPLSADAIAIDEIHRAHPDGVFAAGDVCSEQPSLAGSIAAGAKAAMIIVQSLLADEFGLPYPPV